MRILITTITLAVGLVLSCKEVVIKPQRQDLCAASPCGPGQICDMGVCECPYGYTGDNCSIQITPPAMRIFSMSVLDFPETNNGQPWDLDNSGPELGIHIYKDGVLIGESWGSLTNAVHDSINHLQQLGSITLSEPTEIYTFVLYDSDGLEGGTSEIVKSIDFIPYHSTNGFPQFPVFQSSDSDAAFKLNVSYDF